MAKKLTEVKITITHEDGYKTVVEKDFPGAVQVKVEMTLVEVGIDKKIIRRILPSLN